MRGKELYETWAKELGYGAPEWRDLSRQIQRAWDNTVLPKISEPEEYKQWLNSRNTPKERNWILRSCSSSLSILREVLSRAWWLDNTFHVHKMVVSTETYENIRKSLDSDKTTGMDIDGTWIEPE